MEEPEEYRAEHPDYRLIAHDKISDADEETADVKRITPDSERPGRDQF